MTAPPLPVRAPAHVPPVPAPPHDPTWHRLDARAGWRDETPMDGVEEEPDGRALTLARAPGARRRVDEPSGSLGGLVPPSTVAVAGDGSVYLLDRVGARLLRFDGCECRFEVVPCWGGFGGGARALVDPRAIVIDGASLYLADAGTALDGGRVTVWTLPEMALRAVWTLPPAPPQRPQPWRPVSVASDGRGALWVADPANAMVHRFDRMGRRRASAGGMGGVRRVAADCAGRVYAVLDGEPEARVLSADGTPDAPPGDRVADPTPLRRRFPRLPFASDSAGRLDLGALCARGGPAWFDLTGAAIAPPDTSGEARWVAAGTWIAGPLDSRLHRCQWHRVVLDADVPSGTRASVGTWTAEAPPTAADVAALPDAAWGPALAAPNGLHGEWDALVRSDPGRWLWLRVRLAGSGAATPRLRSVRVEFPRVSLRRYLPAVWSEDALAADFADRFLAVFDTGFRDVERRLDGQASLFDPLATPAAALPWLGSWIGATLGRQWPEQVRRQFVKRAAEFFRLHGTRAGLRRQLLFFLGMEGCGGEGVCPEALPRITRCDPRLGPCSRPESHCRPWQPPPLILEHWQLRRWLFVGCGRLGDRAVLWGQRIVNRSQLLAAPARAAQRPPCDARPPAPPPDAVQAPGAAAERAGSGGAQAGVTQLVTTPDPLRDPFHVYAHRFTVFAPAARACTPERRRAIEGVVAAAAPAHTLWHVEWVEPRFRIGFQSMIGLDSVVGRWPRGVTTDATRLGPASVLGGGPPESPPRTRIGTLARL